MIRIYLLVLSLCSLAVLCGCFCGFNASNANIDTGCLAVENYSAEIGDLEFTDRRQPILKLDTLNDTIQVVYEGGSSEYWIHLAMEAINGKLSLDSVNSFVEHKQNGIVYHFVAGEFSLEVIEFSENQCCQNLPDACGEEEQAIPGAFIITLNADIRSLNETTSFLLLLDIRCREYEHSEC